MNMKRYIRCLPRQQIVKQPMAAKPPDSPPDLNLLTFVFRLTQRSLEYKECQPLESSDMHSLSAHRLRAFVV
jgi:hypothetical protein